jgi:putative aldouronate transport system permease protein
MANTFLLLLFAIIILLPVVFVVVRSFIGEAEIARRGQFILIPENLDTSAYKTLWGVRTIIIRGYKNTLFRVIVGTTMNMICTIGLAYGLSRPFLKGRKVFSGLIAFTMLFSGGMVPTYMVVRSFGLINSKWSMIIPSMVSAWNLFMMRNFFAAIPEELTESAHLDGANHLQTLIQVVLPCSLASLATIGLFYAVWHWNAWFDSMIYIMDSKKLPMQNILRNVIIASQMSDIDATAVFSENYAKTPTESMRSATIVVSTLPILVAYPYVQKYFVQGVMVGSIKG